MERVNSLFTFLCCVHALRLVDNNDRVRGLDELDRAAAGHAVMRSVNNVGPYPPSLDQ